MNAAVLTRAETVDFAHAALHFAIEESPVDAAVMKALGEALDAYARLAGGGASEADLSEAMTVLDAASHALFVALALRPYAGTEVAL